MKAWTFRRIAQTFLQTILIFPQLDAPVQIICHVKHQEGAEIAVCVSFYGRADKFRFENHCCEDILAGPHIPKWFLKFKI